MLDGQFAANRVEAAAHSDRRIIAGLALPDPLLIAPVEIADRARDRVLPLLDENQFAGNTTHRGIGEAIDEALNGPGRNFRPYVGEDDDVGGCLLHAGIERDGLTAMVLEENLLQPRIGETAKELRGAVG